MIFLLFIFLLWNVQSSFGEAEGEYKIVVKTVTGRVSFVRPPANTQKTVRIGTILRQRDVVYTEAESSVEIVFENGSEVKIQENALLNLVEVAEKIAEGRTLLKLSAGRLFFKINSLTGELASFRFETPTFSAAIRGTEGEMGLWGNNSLVYLREGRLLMEPMEHASSLDIGPLDLCVYNGKDLRKMTFTTTDELDSAVNAVQIAFITKKDLDKIFVTQEQLFFEVD